MENKEIKTEDLNKSELNELELESISSGKNPYNRPSNVFVLFGKRKPVN